MTKIQLKLAARFKKNKKTYPERA
ncbi:uncharacterized protein METZ01_LOCUS276068 [marine metagenome]|uniref:Uncharacterized protein n=1 Tax=marine metagenome TaxID=408172 RepID=A0A382KDY2_9ZZZZ